MNQNELRIGNLLSYGAHGTATVIDVKASGKIKIHIHSKESHEKGYVNPTVHTVYLDPIPLTPEWLERCGFEALEYGVWDGPKIELDETVEYFTIEEHHGGYMLKGSEWVMGKPFHNLHQLQNLYFALTGEELQIKEP